MPQIYPEDRGMNYAIKFGNKIVEEILKDYKIGRIKNEKGN